MRIPPIDVLLPYRPADPHRTAGLNIALFGWDNTRFPHRLHIGGDGSMSQPWNKAVAVNRLLDQVTGEKVLLYGSDHLPPSEEKLAEISAALDEHPFVGCFTRHSTLSAATVGQLWRSIQTHDTWPPVFRHVDFHSHAPFALGVVAARRDALTELGGLDERFVGWGGEDIAIREAAAGLWGPVPQLAGQVISVWHPAAARDMAESNMAIVAEYRANKHRMRDYLNETLRARTGQRPAL